MIATLLALIPNSRQLLITIGLMIISFGAGSWLEYKNDSRKELIKEQKAKIEDLTKQNEQLNSVIEYERQAYEIINNKAYELQQSLESSVAIYNKTQNRLDTIKAKLNNSNRINIMFMRIISEGATGKSDVSKTAKVANRLSESEATTSIQPVVAAKYIIDNFQYCNTNIIKYNNLIDFYNQIELNFNKGN